jgi:hypothetical protein
MIFILVFFFKQIKKALQHLWHDDGDESLKALKKLFLYLFLYRFFNSRLPDYDAFKTWSDFTLNEI